MKKITIKDRIRYEFENTLSKGTIAIIGWLALLSLIIVLIAGFTISINDIRQDEQKEALSFFEASWQSLMHALDAGSVAGDSGWTFRMVMLLVTIGGIFILSSLIGVLTSGLDNKLMEMRKGRSFVIEKDHILILGWSPKIFQIISELIIANANHKKGRIVILSEKDKIEMEDELAAKIPDTKTTKIICRTGSPLDLMDLSVVNVNNAKSIVIMSPQDENPDIFAIKTILALTNNPGRKPEPYHIVAEIKNEDNLAAAKMVGGNEAIFVLSADLIARVTAQTCRQSGLSVVYTELLDFDGVEIHFKEEPALFGKTFRDAVYAYNDSSVFGLLRKSGEVLVNPPEETVLGDKDQVIVIAEDDDSIILSTIKEYGVKKELFSDSNDKPIVKEKTLILGWNEKAIRIISEIENYVAAGSAITILSDSEEMEAEIQHILPQLKKQKVEIKKGDITNRELLDSMKIVEYDHIILLSYMDRDIQESDAKTLICLLHLRNISEIAKVPLSIVSEMRDNNNRILAEVTKADDFIVSERIISLMLSQLSEKKELKKVFDILFEAEGSEVYLKPVSDFVKTGEKMNFYTVTESALLKKCVAIGYRIAEHASNAEKAYGVVINPKKSEEIVFQPGDKIVVVAED